MKQTCNSLTQSRMEDVRHLICNQVEKGCTAIHSHAETSVRAFYKELSSKIPGWVENYRSFHHVDSIFKVKSQSEAYAEELVDSLQNYIKGETQTWATTLFVPMIAREINNLRCAIDKHAAMMNDPLGHISVTIDLNKNAIVKSSTPSAKNRALSTGASLLIGDWGGAIMGGVGGSDAMIKTMGCELAAGITLGIIALFTPVGLAALVGSVIASAFVGGTWALDSVEKKIRKTIVKNSVEYLNSPKEMNKFMNVMHGRIDDLLTPLRKGLESDYYIAYSA